VNLSGQGHVVCYNRTVDFWDHINIFTNALADPSLGQQARAIDFYNNDMRFAHDNFIETDGGMTNLRVMRNRVVHSPYTGWADPLSTQPVYQGPVYFLRNIVYNNSDGDPTVKYPGSGLVMWHNSSTSSQPNSSIGRLLDKRNNVFMPPTTEPTGDSRKKPRTLTARDRQRGEVIDYNAYLKGDFSYPAYRIGNDKEVETLAELARETGHERHSLELDSYDVFRDVPPAWYVWGYRSVEDKAELDWTENEALDFTPSEGSPLIDAGTVIPGINEDYAGQAPDIGAVEHGKPASHFGPREQNN
jgi:hypothetical protein